MEDNSIKKDFTSFSRAVKEMIATSEKAYQDIWEDRFSSLSLKSYTKEEIQRIIEDGSLESKKKLSRTFFYTDSFYKRLVLYYATLLKYTGILIPTPAFGHQIQERALQKRYYKAVSFLDAMNLKSFLTNSAINAIVDGTYFGLRQTPAAVAEQFVVMDLPSAYCRSRFKDFKGNDIIEFNVMYFDTILDEDSRQLALNIYPKYIGAHYRKYQKGKASKWIQIPPDTGICFPFLDDGFPLLLNVIPAILDYDEAVEVEKERDLEEIKKIIVQKIPHLTDGGLLIEPNEAKVMHDGTVGMMRGNKNVSVLTTYADVDAIVSKTASDSVSNTLEKMVNNIYYAAGTSGQLFGAGSNLQLETSIKNDLSLVLVLANKFQNFITNLINSLFADRAIKFKYELLPVTEYNSEKYVDLTLKMANSGYSFLLPSLALGFSQSNFSNIKDLENNVLNLQEKLIPLQTSYTQSSSDAGAPTKEVEEKAESTIRSEESRNNGDDII